MGKKFKKISAYTPSIFQGKLDFSAARSGASLTVEHPYEATLMRVLLACLLGLCAAYLYFVGASVLNIIARKEASAEAVRLQSSIASMEAEYFALSHSVDSSVAESIGLKPIAQTEYVYRPGAVAATIGANGL